ncbi:hypothetical protein [Planotetraspora sp. GP83]|uniref:hypothetical protein n=1 Tax=Planotetraspora sp. GP83 TaxID=3156264 RepID=UPI003513C228
MEANPAMGPVTSPAAGHAVGLMVGPAVGLAGGPAIGAAMGSAMGPVPEQPGPLGPLQAQCAVTLQQLYGWLQASLPQAPQIAGVIPLLVQAVQMYRIGRHEACMAQIQSVLSIVDGACGGDSTSGDARTGAGGDGNGAVTAVRPGSPPL